MVTDRLLETPPERLDRAILAYSREALTWESDMGFRFLANQHGGTYIPRPKLNVVTGSYNAICSGVYDCGTQNVPKFQRPGEFDEKPLTILTFTVLGDDGDVLGETYKQLTTSVHAKSAMKAWVETMTNTPVTGDNIEKLLKLLPGRSVTLWLEETSKGDNVRPTRVSAYNGKALRASGIELGYFSLDESQTVAGEPNVPDWIAMQIRQRLDH